MGSLLFLPASYHRPLVIEPCPGTRFNQTYGTLNPVEILTAISDDFYSFSFYNPQNSKALFLQTVLMLLRNISFPFISRFVLGFV